jgi:S1-C subfamily serine protease
VELKMLSQTAVISFFGFIAAVLGLGMPVHAQTPDLRWTSVPSIGDASVTQDMTETTSVESPLPEGLSFHALGDLVKGLASQAKLGTRGPQEIAIFRQAAPAVVLLKTNDGAGSGIVLENGLILTNRHVVEGVGVVQIFFKPTDLSQGNQATESRLGRIQFVDTQRDLALIRPDSLPVNYKFLKISPRNDFEVGSDVYAIGHPMGYAWTFTQGIISGVRAINTEEQHYTAIQTQTPINPGNSGGPLLNSTLEVLGINTWVRLIAEKQRVAGEEVSITSPAQGLNFAVSARDLRGFLNDTSTGKIANQASITCPISRVLWSDSFQGKN